MRPLTIAAYFDGRLGHEKQTQGILNALAGMTPVDINSFRVTPSTTGYIKNWAIFLFPFFHKVSTDMTHPADLIIGTGSHTHLPMLIHKKNLGKLAGSPVHVVTCMTPDRHLMRHFDLCFIPMHDKSPAAANVSITEGPPNTVRFAGIQQDDSGLILVGGEDPKSHIWRSVDTVSRIRSIIDKDSFMTWTISSSPRSPNDVCRKLEKLASENKNVVFFRSDDTPTGWIEEQYGINGTVWVTADSVSMVYEALTAGCSVGVLPVEWLHEDNKFNRGLKYLSENKMIVSFDEWQISGKLRPRRTSLLDVSFRCAREILKRWWPDRLQ